MTIKLLCSGSASSRACLIHLRRHLRRATHASPICVARRPAALAQCRGWPIGHRRAHGAARIAHRQILGRQASANAQDSAKLTREERRSSRPTGIGRQCLSSPPKLPRVGILTRLRNRPTAPFAARSSYRHRAITACWATSPPALPPRSTSIADAWPGLKVEEHSGKFTWQAPIELAAGVDPAKLEIAGAVYAQICAESCLPPKDYKFVATVAPGPAARRDVPGRAVLASKSGPPANPAPNLRRSRPAAPAAAAAAGEPVGRQRSLAGRARFDPRPDRARRGGSGRQGPACFDRRTRPSPGISTPWPITIPTSRAIPSRP